MVILSKVIYRFSGVPIKLPRAFFIELEQQQQQILQFLWRPKRPWIAQAILEKRNGVGEIRLPGFRHYYTGAVIKAAWSLYKNRNIDQQNRIENLEIKPMNLWWPNLWQEGKDIQWRKGSLFNKWCWKNWKPTCKKWN